MIENMKHFLGIDTSNYTTSLALCDENGTVRHVRRLLPVKEGELGLRQSDAVFHHTQQLPALAQELFKDCRAQDIAAIGVSSRPRDIEGSYMPCFTIGRMLGSVLSSALHVPMYEFSHQCGHIMAAVYSVNRFDLIEKPFIAFHVSGGTTEALLVQPDDKKIIGANIIAKTLDLNAGQLIDRVGVMLGLKFPAGAELEKLASRYDGDVKVRPALKGADCCLSGAENIAQKMISNGDSPEKTAYFTIKLIGFTIAKMCDEIRTKHPNIPILFAGGVMSDMLIRRWIDRGEQTVFSLSSFSSDNAAGTAVLTHIKAQRKKDGCV